MGTVLFPQHVIARKRDGGELSQEEIAAFVRGATDRSWADYQLSALLMAIFIRGMTPKETVFLTEAMLKSGVVADLSGIAGAKADKHSTGGVGDKISLHLAPMVAACGVGVPMISGRGLGHTGGTLDKLESIPGFRVGLSIEEYKEQLAKIGICLIGQTGELAPADKKLYSLRDVTGTVECIPLICASILSKKLASGIDVLVLDVKFGRGAFMKDLARARELAVALTTVANSMGTPTRAVLTAMEEPLGHAVGNALEVAESIAFLKGPGAHDMTEVTFAIGEQMLILAKAARDTKEARAKLEATITSGSALAKFREMVAAQGGDVRVVDDPSLLPQAKLKAAFAAKSSGFVTDVDAMGVALAALRLGAGRAKAEDPVDHAVGIDALIKVGGKVKAGDPLCVIHASSEAAAREASDILARAIVIGDAAPAPRTLIGELVG
ncbi:MAG TPA: thymidine phosphorylase [Opitutaceae bacterium]|jgi:pyrimidine-nucleoside phosphorylase|nr:thymidine phosphorylase [Opitutaceae bacterium]